MDPVTHLLASYTVARATRATVLSPRMAVILLAGLASDVDWLWHLPAPLSAIRAYGTAGHSLVGAGALSLAIVAAVWAAARKRATGQTGLAGLPGLLAAAVAAAGLHLLLDVSTGAGIEPWWPFRAERAAWNLTPTFDVVTVVLLMIFALIPGLVVMIQEEIGARVDPRPSRAWPLAALVLLGAWLGARAEFHGRAEHMLGAAEYLERAPLHYAAFPAGWSPLRWRGVVETDLFLAEIEVTLGTGQPLPTDSAVLHYKPEASPAVDAVAAAPLARGYTALARFPLLVMETSPDGARAQMSELGDSLLRTRDGAWSALIDLDAQSRVTHEDLLYLRSRSY
jgi:membrane-bound metal-dependent hydrolase YbcI (DUF457 family)